MPVCQIRSPLEGGEPDREEQSSRVPSGGDTQSVARQGLDRLGQARSRRGVHGLASCNSGSLEEVRRRRVLEFPGDGDGSLALGLLTCRPPTEEQVRRRARASTFGASRASGRTVLEPVTYRLPVSEASDVVDWLSQWKRVGLIG